MTYQWRTATDPPKEPGEYICTNGQLIYLAWYDARKNRWWADSDGATYFAGPIRVTHWMNKPPLPKE